ncbi:MAG: tRNA 2-thiouridine(34) synthase MnmA [Breznakibacter sp.]
MEQQNPDKVLLAMSGGTDSSMAALLLLEQGYEVVGMTMVMFDLPGGEMPRFVSDASNLAQRIGIGHHVVDVRNRFNQAVVDYFLEEYAQGRTPNPCVRCNEHLKWVVLAQTANELGCAHIATGHYSQIGHKSGVHYIHKGIDVSKDQSYFLYRLPQSILQRALLPLGQWTKARVKEEAFRRGFPSLSHKKESMGVCFMNGKSLHEFLKANITSKVLEPGRIVDRCGMPVGKHGGVAYYTVGQKKGLELHVSGNWCVVGIDAERNALIAGPSWALQAQKLWADQIYFANINDIESGKTYQVKIRGIDQVPYHEGKLSFKDNLMQIDFMHPVWAVAPGQSVVVYDGDRVLGGGVAK